MTCPDCEGTGKSARPGLSCFACNGSGELCDRCGEASEAGQEMCDSCREDEENEGPEA